VESSDAPTLDTSRTSTRAQVVKYIGLSILCHPDLRRLGETARLFDVDKRGRATLSRSEPVFRDPAGRNPSPLGTARVSRLPVSIRLSDGGRVHIEPNRELEVFVDGALVRQPETLAPCVRDADILLRLSKYVLLRLGVFEADPEPQRIPELVGNSPCMRRLRAEISRVGDLDVPVLLRGETGVGKELVAAALHGLSKRRDGPYVCVNMAAIPPPMAAAELFGHARGAFTGAAVARDGYFVDAHQGSLFLDEIGDTTPEVQSVLLRVIESGVIQPLGGGLRSVSVRLLTATDSNLEMAVERGSFSRALLQRFGYELWVPPLRERIDDIPMLFARFLAEELRSFGEESRLAGPDHDQKPFLNADLVMQLMRHPWPGNVRELRTVARRFAIYNRGRERTRIDERLQAMLNSSAPEPVSEVAAPARRETSQLKDEQVLDALRRHRFEIERTARELRVSRSWLHARMNALPGVRKAKDLEAEEIQAALERHAGDMEAAAEHLEVSAKGLQLQMARLGLR
jgi:two-component system nitrogen regulation response regulator GlnG